MKFLLTDTYENEMVIYIIEAESINDIKSLIVSDMGRELTGFNDKNPDFDPDDTNLDTDKYGFRDTDWDISVYDDEIHAWVEDHNWYVEALDKIPVKTVKDLMTQSRG